MRGGLARAVASSTDTCRRIWRHPENEGRRIRTIGVYVAWQAWERTIKRPWVVTLAPGRRIRCYPHCAISSGTLYYRLPERSSMRFMLDYLRPGDAVIDVGSNLGTYSLLATTVEGVSALAFEPSTIAYERAIANVELNGLDGRVTVAHQAVGAAPGDIVLSVGLGACNRVIDGANGATGERVEMVTLDQVLAEGAQPVSLVKIDVEGGEIDVLRGARRLLERHAPALIVEVNDPPSIEACLAEAGYSCHVYEPASRRLLPTRAEQHLHRNVIALADLDAAQARVGPLRALAGPGH